MTFPDFSAFQIDIPHGPEVHDSSWPLVGHSNPDLYSAFWPDFHAHDESAAGPAPVDRAAPPQREA
ncbi:hypothetical protein ACIQC5_20305 [Paenarthrobacter sp. NPDC092416]|uniref:hypothetical protein n=1 Tax=Paenarthrobacter sp. NPDC092416 TaxID=3364386 RepID=UPI0038018F78